MKKLLLIAILLFIVCPAYACIGARNLSLGHSGVTTANDSTATYWNPALLPFIENNVSYGSNFDQLQKYFSASYNNLGFCNVEYNTYKYFYFSYGKIINQNLSLGLGLGGQYDFADGTDPEPSIEFGLLYKNNTPFKYGVLFQDDNLRPSVSWANDNFLISINAYDLLNRGNNQRYSIGCEYKYKMISFRTGIDYSKYFYPDNIRYDYGIGLNYKQITADIGKIDDKYVFSISYYFQ